MASKPLHFAFLATVLMFCVFGSATDTYDIEAMHADQGIVTKTKQIHIPGFPLAFNPSIVRFQGGNLLSFRIVPDRKNTFTSYIGLIWLNDELDPIGFPQILETRRKDQTSPSRAEDARLITLKDRLFMVYDDNEEQKISKGGFRVYVSELTANDKGIFQVKSLEIMSEFNGASRDKREKSWVPFIFENQLLLSYSIVPHLVFKPHLNQSNACETVSFSEDWSDWDYGVPRGGTTALDMGSHYLSFFHSSKKVPSKQSDGLPVWHYFMGAYTFSKQKPFKITQVTKDPIVGQGFYSGTQYTPYWKPVSVIFPGGFIVQDNYFWVAYGRNDHEVWVAELDRKELAKTLKPIGQP